MLARHGIHKLFCPTLDSCHIGIIVLTFNKVDNPLEVYFKIAGNTQHVRLDSVLFFATIKDNIHRLFGQLINRVREFITKLLNDKL